MLKKIFLKNCLRVDFIKILIDLEVFNLLLL